MIRKAFYIFLFLAAELHAQKMIIGTENSAAAFSNSISNQVTDQMLMSRYIDQKKLSKNKIHSSNYFFADLSSSVYFTYFLQGKPEKEASGFNISLSHRSLIAASFSSDAYHIIFEGNAGYADRTANLSGLALNRLTYQTLEGGYFKAVENGSWYYYGYAGLGIVKGQRTDDVGADRFTLYTQPDGEYLDVDAKVNYTYCKEGKSPLAFNGVGAALHLKTVIKNIEKNWEVELEAKDAGFIRWMNTTKTAGIDSSFRFDGFPVSLLSSDVKNTAIGDSLSNLLEQHTKDYRKSTLIPARFSIAFTKRFERSSITAGLSYYAFGAMRFPYTRCDYKYNVTSNFQLTALVRYGFYNNFNIGVAADLLLTSRCKLQLGILNLPALIVPSKTYSQGLFFSLAYLL